MKENKTLQVVVETHEFMKQAKKHMSAAARFSFINYIAMHPEAGSIIQDTGGARKVRWHKNEHSGKRGGVRVIYYYHDKITPIFLFTVYSKNQKDNLPQSERQELKSITSQITQINKEDRHE